MSDIERLRGPILVLGGHGFIGKHLVSHLRREREDVFAPEYGKGYLVDAKTVFNLIAYGQYPEHKDVALIYETNFVKMQRSLQPWRGHGDVVYVNAGSSSEYGTNAAGPLEDEMLTPNSHYAVSKAAGSALLHYMGKHEGFPCAHLRLYSVYGPGERQTRLIPSLIAAGREGRYPPLVHPDISRDFVYVEDVCEAFIKAAVNLTPEHYGEAFNIGTGTKTTIRFAAEESQRFFGFPDTRPVFGTMLNRAWDVRVWYANPTKARLILGWESKTSFEGGFRLTAAAGGG